MDTRSSDASGEKSEASHNVTAIDSKTRKAERRLRTKIDLHIVPIVTLLYLMCFIDRTNVGNARLAGFEEDLKLKGYDYNMALSVFYISYIIFEIPTTILCKAMGPGWFLPLTTFGFGAVSIATAFVQTRAQACVVRFLLGIFEAGVMPGCTYYLSRWYCRSELTFRLGLWMSVPALGGAFGGLLASGILKLSHFGSLHSWQMIFAVEGIITMGLALISLFILTDRPDTARWLSEEEKEWAVNRVKSERLAQVVLLDKMDAKKMMRGFTNPITLATASVFLLSSIPVLGLSFFLPTIVRTIYPNRTIIHLQLLTVPPYIVGTCCSIFMSLWSWRIDSRQTLIACTGPTVIAGYAIFLATNNANVRYGAVFLTASTAFSLGALTAAQVSANVLSDSARSIAIGTNAMAGYFAGLISTWTFLPSDAPNYHIGNGINLTCGVVWTFIAVGAGVWMKYDNKKRDKKEAGAPEELAGLTQKEIQELEWKHPGWRWKP